MKRAIVVGAALLAALGCGGPESRNMTAEEVAAELRNVRIEPGLWESTSRIVEVAAPNMPRQLRDQMVGDRRTVRNCITPEQAERPDANFFTAQQNNDCTYRDFAMRNGRLEGSMACSGGGMPGRMTTRMEGEYGPTRYNMVMHMEIGGLPDGGGMTIEARSTGRRIGECPAEGQSEGPQATEDEGNRQ